MEHLCHPSQVGGVAHLLVEGDDEHDEQVAEEADEDDDREKDGHYGQRGGKLLFIARLRGNFLDAKTFFHPGTQLAIWNFFELCDVRLLFFAAIFP